MLCSYLASIKEEIGKVELVYTIQQLRTWTARVHRQNQNLMGLYFTKAQGIDK
jgi:hypothetical protein